MKQRNKNILLVAGFLVVLIMAYQFAFSETIELKTSVDQLKKNYSDSQQVNQLSADIKIRNKYADSILSSKKVSNGSVQTNLLDYLNLKSEESKISISEFSEPHIFAFENGKSQSYFFSLQGDYESLEHTLYDLEQNYSFGEVINASFLKLRDYRKQQNYLELTVILNNHVSD